MKKINNLLIVASAFVMAACGASGDDTGYEYAPQMYHAVSYEPLIQITDTTAGLWLTSTGGDIGEFFTSNPYNKDSMNMRMPVANTIPRSAKGFLPYSIPKDSLDVASAVLVSPIEHSPEALAQGKVLYERFCQHCHGATGQGDGKVGQIFLGVPAYNKGAVKDYSEGHIFHVITYGIRRMGAHGSQLSVEERWEIVQYVQELQKQ